MTDYVLWTRTLQTQVWAPSLLRNRTDGRLTEWETRAAIGQPMLVATTHEGLSLQELARLYPCPGLEASAKLEKARKLQALADDPGAMPEERASAARKAAQMRGEKPR